MRNLSIAALVLLSAFSVTAIAQQAGGAAMPDFSFVSPKQLTGNDYYYLTANATELPGGKQMIIRSLYDEPAKTYRYQSFVIDAGGKVTGPTTIFSSFYQHGENVATLWIDGEGAGVASDGYVLVYIIVFPYDTNQTVGHLHSLRLDAKGKLLSAPQKIATFNAIAPHHVNYATIRAAAGENAVLVALSFLNWQNTDNTYGPRKGQMYLLQTDFKGAIKGAAQAVSLPSAGEYRNYRVFSPLWTGKSWFVPFEETVNVYNPSSQWGKIAKSGNAIHLLAATPSGTSLKTKLSRIYQDTYRYGGVNNASFVPATDGAAAPAGTWYLVFGTAIFDNTNQKPLEYVTSRLYVQTIGKKGAPKGAYREFTLPKRKHTIASYDQNIYWEDEGSGEFSNVALDADGKPVIAHFRGTMLTMQTDQSKKLFDTEFSIYQLDLVKGTVKTVQWAGAKKLPAGYLRWISLIGSGESLRGMATGSNYPTDSLQLFDVR